MRNYARVARIIKYLEAHRAERVELAVLAAEAGLSLSDFQRRLSVWAGMIPQKFLQGLSFDEVKHRLRSSANIFETGSSPGLSGAGQRQHVCVSLEAASPDEVKSGGHGWTMTFGYADTPFGDGLLAEGPRGICHLAFVENAECSAIQAEWQKAWPAAIWKRSDRVASQLAAKVFYRSSAHGQPPRFTACVKGSEFQLRVWRALLCIPPGALVSYGQLALAVGQPLASRAVGTAVGQNPLAYLVPCHRVIRQTGEIGGYRWGVIRKQAMIAWESASDMA